MIKFCFSTAPTWNSAILLKLTSIMDVFQRNVSKLLEKQSLEDIEKRLM